MGGSILPEAKEYLDKMVKEGHTEGRFKFLQHATYFKTLVERHKHIPSLIERKLGNANTFDSKNSDILKEHFHVHGVRDAAHRILGKFV